MLISISGNNIGKMLFITPNYLFALAHLTTTELILHVSPLCLLNLSSSLRFASAANLSISFSVVFVPHLSPCRNKKTTKGKENRFKIKFSMIVLNLDMMVQ